MTLNFVSFGLEKLYLLQNGVEFHQKLIGAIVRHKCAHSGTNWPILVDKIDKNLYEVKCQVRILCAPPPLVENSTHF